MLLAGLLLALVTGRCLFSNAPVFLHLFTDSNTYDWSRHEEKLQKLGRAIDGTHNINSISAEGLSAFVLYNQTELFLPFQAVVLDNDFDYSAPFLLVRPRILVVELPSYHDGMSNDLTPMMGNISYRQIHFTRMTLEELFHVEKHFGHWRHTCSRHEF